MRKFGLPVVVALNRFTGDTEAEYDAVRSGLPGVEVVLCSHWADGGAGAEDLARAVMRRVEGGTATTGRCIRTRCRWPTSCAPWRARSTAPPTSP